MILLVFTLLSCLRSTEAKSADVYNPIATEFSESILFASSTSESCYYDFATLADDGDLEKDMEDDGSFSKDLDGCANFEFEITPLPLNADSHFKFSSLLSKEIIYGYDSIYYKSPYLKYFQPPKIATRF